MFASFLQNFKNFSTEEVIMNFRHRKCRRRRRRSQRSVEALWEALRLEQPLLKWLQWPTREQEAPQPPPKRLAVSLHWLVAVKCDMLKFICCRKRSNPGLLHDRRRRHRQRPAPAPPHSPELPWPPKVSHLSPPCQNAFTSAICDVAFQFVKTLKTTPNVANLYRRCWLTTVPLRPLCRTPRTRISARCHVTPITSWMSLSVSAKTDPMGNFPNS